MSHSSLIPNHALDHGNLTPCSYLDSALTQKVTKTIIYCPLAFFFSFSHTIFSHKPPRYHGALLHSLSPYVLLSHRCQQSLRHNLIILLQFGLLPLTGARRLGKQLHTLRRCDAIRSSARTATDAFVGQLCQ